MEGADLVGVERDGVAELVAVVGAVGEDAGHGEGEQEEERRGRARGRRCHRSSFLSSGGAALTRGGGGHEARKGRRDLSGALLASFLIEIEGSRRRKEERRSGSGWGVGLAQVLLGWRSFFPPLSLAMVGLGRVVAEGGDVLDWFAFVCIGQLANPHLVDASVDPNPAQALLGVPLAWVEESGASLFSAFLA